MKKTKSMVMGAAVLAALMLPMVAGADNKLVVRNAGDTADAAVVTDGGYLGLGTGTPLAPLHIKSAGSNITSAAMKAEFVSKAIGTASSTNPQPFWGPNFTFLRNNELTSGVITLPRANDNIGTFYYSANGVTNSGGINAATIQIQASSQWTAINTPTKFTINLNPGGDNVGARQALTIANTGTATFNGGLRIFPYTGSVLPTKSSCSSSTAGTIWFTKSTGAGVADKMEVCITLDGSAYSWKSIAFQ